MFIYIWSCCGIKTAFIRCRQFLCVHTKSVKIVDRLARVHFKLKLFKQSKENNTENGQGFCFEISGAKLKSSGFCVHTTPPRVPSSSRTVLESFSNRFHNIRITFSQNFYPEQCKRKSVLRLFSAIFNSLWTRGSKIGNFNLLRDVACWICCKI